MTDSNKDKPSLKISIPSKENKQASQLRDSLRILAWQQFKLEYEGKMKGLELYKDVFEPEWNKHEVHEMSLVELMEMIKSLGYTISEVLNVRSKYYREGRGITNGRNNGEQLTERTERSDDVDDIPF